MKRSAGITIVAILLFFLSFAAFGNLLAGIEPKTSITKAITALYGLSALTTAIGLWKLKSWTFKSYLVWMVVIICTLLDFQFGRYGIYRAPIGIFAGFSVLVLTILGLLARYIKTKTITV